jgi:hypothetical protein
VVHFKLIGDTLTKIIVVGTIMVTPIYALATYLFSGASPRKGMQIGAAFLLFSSVMLWVCVSGLPGRLGLAGNLIVPAAWLLPSAVLIIGRRWFLDQRLSQRWLVGSSPLQNHKQIETLKSRLQVELCREVIDDLPSPAVKHRDIWTNSPPMLP